MRGRRLLLMALLVVGVGLGAVVGGAPWDTPNEPVRPLEPGGVVRTTVPSTSTTVGTTDSTASNEEAAGASGVR